MSAEVGSVSHTQELAAFQGVTGRRRQITDEYIEPELTGTRSLTPSYHHYSGPSHDSTETSHIDDARRLGFIAASSPQPGRNYNVTKPGDLLDFDALGSRSSSSQLFKDLRSHPRDDHSARDGHSADTEAVLQAQHNIDMQYNGQGEVAEEVPERYIGDRTPSTSSDAEGDSPGVSIGLQPGGSACSDIASHASPALEMLTESKSIVGSAATSEESSQTKRKIVKKGGKRKRRLTTAKSTGRTTRHAFAQIAARSSTKRSKEEYTDLKGKDTPEEALGKLGCSFGQEPDVSKDSKKVNCPSTYQSTHDLTARCMGHRH
ncbi:hypothetical protein QFC22_005893 [Naganishia vaughanmartiniae]|uniref:Uncharacterized protein n=1 Tax=Naganishia vaughanmartiniae TaxID=1424756 RepID=A0ACC2WRF7_9TREE|nr:hypothetical protein QFC22_005893 [Naganishia vaughanmartiniae]